jgi:hypothetical protein
VIEHETVVAVGHLEQRSARNPVAIGVANESSGCEPQAVVRISQA